MTPQLQQAIRLLALSNLEVESFIAEEIERNPLLDGGGGEEAPAAEAPAPEIPRGAGRRGRASASGEAPLDLDVNDENLHQDSASDRALDGGLGMEGLGGGGWDGEGPDFDSFAAEGQSLHDHLLAQAGERLSGPDLVIAGQIIEQVDETGYLLATTLELAGRLGAPARRGRAGPRHRPELRSGRDRRPQPRRMPRPPGQGGRPLRPGDGAADRQSRLSRQGQFLRPEADLRGRRRGSRRHGPRASRLRSQARLPLRRRASGSRRWCRTCSSPAAASAGRSS